MEQNQPFEVRHERDFGQSVNAPFAVLRQNFRGLARSILYIAGPAVLVASIMQTVALRDFLSAATTGVDPARMGTGFVAEYAISWVFTVFTTSLLAGVITEFMVLHLEFGTGGFDVPDVWNRVREDLGMIIATAFGTALLTLIAFFCFVIPGIYLSVILSILLTVRIVEGESFFGGISRSRSLVQGRWWFTLGLLIVMQIIVAVMGIVFAIPQYIVVFITTFGAARGGGMQQLLLIVSAISTFGSQMLASLTMLAVVLHYFSLVERSDGVGVAARIASIGTTSSDSTASTLTEDRPDRHDESPWQ